MRRFLLLFSSCKHLFNGFHIDGIQCFIEIRQIISRSSFRNSKIKQSFVQAAQHKPEVFFCGGSAHVCEVEDTAVFQGDLVVELSLESEGFFLFPLDAGIDGGEGLIRMKSPLGVQGAVVYDALLCQHTDMDEKKIEKYYAGFAKVKDTFVTLDYLEKAVKSGELETNKVKGDAKINLFELPNQNVRV